MSYFFYKLLLIDDSIIINNYQYIDISINKLIFVKLIKFS